MKCLKCGAELDDDSVFCHMCGAAVAQIDSVPDAANEPEKEDAQAEDPSALTEETENADKESATDAQAADDGENEAPLTQQTPVEAESADGLTDTAEEPGAPAEIPPEAPAEVPAETPVSESEPKVIYRWNYEAQAAADTVCEKREQHRGVKNYAIVMTVCFAVSFLILIASLITGGLKITVPDEPGKTDERVVYVRDGELTEDGTLSTNEIAEAGKNSVVAISIKTPTGKGVGTGIIMREDGYIATNCHVVDGATTIRVRLYDGTMYDAELIGSSEIDDLAVVKIDATGLTPAKFGDSSKVLVGDRVVVIGHPAGLEFGWTTTQGIVSAINRAVKIKDASGTLTKKMTLLQTDANVNNGNSGGPMFNARGEVIGIISMKLSDGYEGMGFAIPINGAMELLQAIIETGSVEGVESSVSSGRPLLGIVGVGVTKDEYYLLLEDRISYLTPEQAAEIEGSFKAGATGVLITDVSAGLDAVGKVKAGDIIVGLNGLMISDFNDLQEALYDCDIGDTVIISFVRGEDTLQAKIKLSAAPES